MFSPDGKRIAFCCLVDRHTNIYIVDKDGANLQRLTHGGNDSDRGAYFDPHFHPDGRHLICVREERDNEEGVLTAGSLIGLYCIDLDTGTGCRLPHSLCDYEPAVSPNGRHLACTRMTHPERRFIPEIFQMSWDGQEQTQLTYTSWEEAPLPARPPRNLSPSYSPNGDLIAFVSSIQGDQIYDIYRMRPDGSEMIRLTDGADSTSIPLWHPDGRHIVYTTWSKTTKPGTKKNSLYLVDVQSTESRLLEESQAIHSPTSFSPDGRWLAFASTRHRRTPNVAQNWDLFLLDMLTGAVHALTDNDVLDMAPQFSPDGQAILFRSERDGKQDLYYAELQF